MRDLVVKGQVFKLQTLHDLVVMICRLRHEKGLSDKIREKITRIGQTNGLLDSEGKPASKCFALLDDDAEKLARELTGYRKQAAGLCACGCGRMTRGKAKTATEACRKRLSRLAA